MCVCGGEQCQVWILLESVSSVRAPGKCRWLIGVNFEKKAAVDQGNLSSRVHSRLRMLFFFKFISLHRCGLFCPVNCGHFFNILDENRAPRVPDLMSSAADSLLSSFSSSSSFKGTV